MTKPEDSKTDTSAVAAIILAAGRSQRMGAFKPLLPFGRTTVIQACIDFLRAGGIETVIIVVGEDARAAELRRHLKDSQVIFAVNSDPTSEMSASIACALREIYDPVMAVIITPADHPAVPAEVVQLLINEWRNGATLVIPTNHGRGGHPVLVDLSWRDEILNLDPSRGLKALFDDHREQVKRVSVDSDYIARDMDTWDEYGALHQEVFRVPPTETSEFEPDQAANTGLNKYQLKARPAHLTHCPPLEDGKGE